MALDRLILEDGDDVLKEDGDGALLEGATPVIAGAELTARRGTLGPFIQTTFFGASVTGFTGSVGWDASSSEFSVDLVEDPCKGPKIRYDTAGGANFYGGADTISADDVRELVSLNDTDAVQLSAGESDLFKPPRLGKPGYFKFSTFEFGGILEGWQETQNIGSGKTYRMTFKGPTDILGGAQVILNGYEGSEWMQVPNLFKVNSPLYCNEAGVSWGEIFSAIHAKKVYLRGNTYLIDLLELAETVAVPLRYTGDSISVLDAILRIATNMGQKVRFELLHASQNIGAAQALGVDGFIKVRIGSPWDLGAGSLRPLPFFAAEDIDYEGKDVAQTTGHPDGESSDVNTAARTRLKSGSLRSFANAFTNKQGNESESCPPRGVMGLTRGLERINSVSNAFVVGDNVQALWGVSQDSAGTYSSDSLIEPFWGFDDSGNARLGTGNGDAHNFDINISNQKFSGNFGGENTPLGYNITIKELRAALGGFQSWLIFMQAFKEDYLNAVVGMGDGEAPFLGHLKNAVKDIVGDDDNAPIGGKQDKGKGWEGKADRWVPAGKRDARGAGMLSREPEPMDHLKSMYSFVNKFGEEFYGKKFFVNLPDIDCCGGAASPGTSDDQLSSWEQSDGGWLEGNMLGLHSSSAAMGIFKTDDGRVGPFLRFETAGHPNHDTNEAPPNIDLDAIQSPFYATDVRTVWVKAGFEKIANRCGSSPGAILTVSGGVYEDPKDQAITNLGDGIWALCIAEAAGKEKLDEDEQKRLSAFLKAPGSNILKGMGLAKLPYMPNGAAVPLKSNVHSYGPFWIEDDDVESQAFSVTYGDESEDTQFTDDDDVAITRQSWRRNVAGQTHYERDTSLNPWTFGSNNSMNMAARIIVASRLNDRHISEQGSVEAAGAPISSRLGSILESGGPNLTNINVQVGIGGVTTSYRFRSYIRNFGEIAKQRVDWMKGVAAKQQKLQRALTKRIVQANTLPAEHSAAYRRAKFGRHAEGFRSSHSYIYAYREDHPFRVVDDEAGADDLVCQYPPFIGSLDKMKAELGIDDDADGTNEGDGTNYLNRAGCSMDGIFRPFDTKLWGEEETDESSGDYVEGNQAIFPYFEKPVEKPLGEGDTDRPAGGDDRPPRTGYGLDGKGFQPWYTLPTMPPIAYMRPDTGGTDTNPQGNQQKYLPIQVKALNPYRKDGKNAETDETTSHDWGTSVGHDIDVVLRGDDIQGETVEDEESGKGLSISSSYRAGGTAVGDAAYVNEDGETVLESRSMGLRGPLVLVGWGFDTEGFPVPNKNEDYPAKKDMAFADNWLHKPQDWKAGPVDLRWDAVRGVWVNPPPFKMVKAVLIEDLLPITIGGEGVARAWIDETQLADKNRAPGRARNLSPDDSEYVSEGFITETRAGHGHAVPGTDQRIHASWTRGQKSLDLDDEANPEDNDASTPRTIWVHDYLGVPMNAMTRILAYYDPDTAEYTVVQAQARPVVAVTDLATKFREVGHGETMPYNLGVKFPLGISNQIQLAFSALDGAAGYDIGTNPITSNESFHSSGDAFDLYAYTRNIWVQGGLSQEAESLVCSGVMIVPDAGRGNGPPDIIEGDDRTIGDAWPGALNQGDLVAGGKITSAHKLQVLQNSWGEAQVEIDSAMHGHRYLNHMPVTNFASMDNLQQTINYDNNPPTVFGEPPPLAALHTGGGMGWHVRRDDFVGNAHHGDNEAPNTQTDDGLFRWAGHGDYIEGTWR